MTKKPQTIQKETAAMATCAHANHAPILDECARGIPKNVISAMVAAGAKKEQSVGEDLCLLRLNGTDSEAWNIFEEWASSLEEVDPMVEAYDTPPAHLRRTLFCPPNALVNNILDEDNAVRTQKLQQ